MYIYESHLGGFFKSDEIIDSKYLYCDSCGDVDFYLGEANTKEELRNLFTDMMEELYLSEYLDSVVEDFFSK